ncbi:MULTISPECIES: sensor histidine kinase [Thiorhodovibrio]|uniref:sensor histidine kinase n=1 Tax=Thiorhodovibrio TaxID=61593 RepID=UPI0019128DD1|nr:MULTISPECIES: PAS domain-containing sensor histidine kinase [Thiorhodovibrio]MBK5968214.1 hypothetical protein [Thiorhodovibrio winogradskyi]WPL14768.1 Cell-division control histidine kinase PdhS [Thiorhodovibrio litoralis]
MPTADSAGSQSAESKQLSRRESRRGLAIPILAGIGLLAVSVILAIWRTGLQQSELEEKFLTETLGLAQALSLWSDQAFDAALAGNEPSAEFTQLSCHLHRFATFAGYAGAWTLIARDGEYRLGPSSDDPSSDCATQAAPAMQAPPADVEQVLASGQADLSARYSRAHLRMISALAPVPNSSGPMSSGPNSSVPASSPESPRTTVLVGLDLPEREWRVAILRAAVLPLALGGLLTLIFAIAFLVVNRSGANHIETATSLRYLEPMLAAMTGVALTITATAITYQLEQDFKSDLLEWESARTSFDLTQALRSLSHNDSATAASSGTQAPATWDDLPGNSANSDSTTIIAAIKQSLQHSASQHNRSKVRIDASILALDEHNEARLVERLSKDQTNAQDQTDAPRETLAPLPPLSAAAQLQELLPVFAGDRTLALRLRILDAQAVRPTTGAAGAAAAIGLILTAVATVLVIWLRGRLASLEQLLNQRTAILQRREENFAAITNAVRDAIIMMDAESKVAYWNPAAERLFGYTEAEARGQDLHQLLCNSATATAYQRRGSAQRPGSSPVVGQLIELEGQHKDGSSLPLELSLSAMQLDGQWHGIGVLRDIAARKRSQARLVKLNGCLANLGSDYRENITRITAVCGEILEADTALYNKLDNGMLTTLGRWNAPDDLPYRDHPEGHICYDLISGQNSRTSGHCGAVPGDNDSREALFLRDLSQTPYLNTDLAVRKYALKAYFGHVVRCGSKNVGSLCVVFKHQRSPSDEEKRLLGILAAALTTEENRHFATRGLELSEKRMSLAMRSTGIGIWEYEPTTRQLRLDESMHGLLALQPTLAVRSIDDWMLRLLPEDMPKLHRVLDNTFEEDDELDEEMRVQIAEDELRYLRIIGSVHRQDRDADCYIIGVCYDITRRKENEARLRHARDMAEQASELKTRFLSQVSHELRTPMNAVLGFGQLLDSDPDLNSDQHDSVREILQSGHHLLKLIDEVLDLAQIESGEADLQVEQLILAPALEESLALIKQSAADHHVHIDFVRPGDLAVAVDPFRLKQILVNLLSNAVKYNRPGGRVGLEAEALPASEDAEERVRIRVSDTGAGIPPEQLKELFEPFRRLPDAQMQGIKGAGLGLAVVKRLVALMNGEIGVASTPGEGSCFWIDLPRRPASLATSGLLKPESASPLLLYDE